MQPNGGSKPAQMQKTTLIITTMKASNGKTMVYVIEVNGIYEICYMNEQKTGYQGRDMSEAVDLCAKHELEVVSLWI